MFNPKLIFLFVIICSMKLEYGVAKIHASRESQTVNEGFLFIGKKSFDNGNFVFAVCDNLTPSKTECNVTQWDYNSQQNNSRMCTVTLTGNNDDTELDIVIGVTALGKNKAILYWGENSATESTLKVGTVHFTTCKLNGSMMRDPAKKMFMELIETDKIVFHDDDSFDIFVNVPKEGVEKLAKLEFDADGNIKGNPIVSDIRSGIVYYLSPLATGSSSKGYAAIRKQDDTSFTLVIVKPDGSEKDIEKYTSASRPAYATGEDVLSECSKANSDSDLTCKQYDVEGNVKFSTIVADKTKSTLPKAIHNLSGGGMLVLLAESKDCEKSGCKDSEFRMMKIASDGKIVGTAPAKEFDTVTSSRGTQTHVYKNVDFGYCAVIIGENPSSDEQKPSDYQILHHCVTDEDFEA